MLIRIYNEDQYEVLARLHEADAGSYSRFGTHDDSRLEVALNGELRKMRMNTTARFTIRDSYLSDWEEEPGEFPQASEIRTASVLANTAHWGGNRRSRSTLRLFSRMNDGMFLVFDLGEVGAIDSNRAPFTTHSFMGAIKSAKKTIRIEFVEGTKIPFLEMMRIQKLEGAYKSPEAWFSSSIVDSAAALRKIADIRAAHCLETQPPHAEDAAIWRQTPLGAVLAVLGLC